MDELPTTAEGTLKLMPSTAKEVAIFSKRLIEAVRSGQINPLELIVQLHALTKVYEEVREEIEENILKETEKYSEKVIERYGARIEKAEVGVKYNYSSSRDSEWQWLDSQVRDFEARRKERETFLRALPGPMTTINKETGVEEDINPPIKTSKTGVKIYLGNVK